jgi:hypothetical protein
MMSNHKLAGVVANLGAFEFTGSKLSLPKVRLNGIQDNSNLSMFIKFCIAGCSQNNWLLEWFIKTDENR